MSPAIRRSLIIRERRIGIVDPATGEIREAEIFVGVLGASNLTYAEATWTQQLPDWIGAHVRMLRFFGGAPKLLVPDNLKSGVHKASFYDPEINRSYGKMTDHYGVGVLPARPYKPRDKAKSRGWRALRPDLHSRAIASTDLLLARRMQRGHRACHATHERAPHGASSGVSRRELFEKIERAALNDLPAEDWEFAEWQRARVNLDYHIEAHDFLYSVPHTLIRAEVDVRITARTVEIFHRGQRVGRPSAALHGRKHGTAPEHNAQLRTGATPSGRRIGSAAGPPRSARTRGADRRRARQPAASRARLSNLPGDLRSYRGVDPVRVEAVSARALELGALNCKSIASLLTQKKRQSGGQRRRPGLPVRPRQCARSRLFTIERKSSCLLIRRLNKLHALGLHGLAKGFQGT